jgi:hypothetical protein
MLVPDFAAVRYFFNYRFPCKGSPDFEIEGGLRATHKKSPVLRGLNVHLFANALHWKRPVLQRASPSGAATK